MCYEQDGASFSPSAETVVISGGCAASSAAASRSATLAWCDRQPINPIAPKITTPATATQREEIPIDGSSGDGPAAL